jgi:hypothetical protein
MVEAMIFRPEVVSQEYDTDIPKSISGKLGVFIEEMARLEAENRKDYSDMPFIISDDEMYKSAYEKSEYKIDLDLAVQYFKEESSQEYFNYLLKDKKLKQVTLELWSKGLKQAESFFNNSFTKDCFKPNGHVQLEVTWRHPLWPTMDFLSILDYVEINHIEKTIYIKDLKTTSKSYEFFQDSIETYHYDWQGALYVRAIESLLGKASQFINCKNYKIVYQIVVSETFYPFRSVIFELTEQTLYKATMATSEHILNMKWHAETKQWDYSKETVKNNGVIKY